MKLALLLLNNIYIYISAYCAPRPTTVQLVREFLDSKAISIKIGKKN